MKNSVNIHAFSSIEELSDEQAMNISGGMENTGIFRAETRKIPSSSYPSFPIPPLPPPPPLPPIDKRKPPYTTTM